MMGLIGEIRTFGRGELPPGWLACDGSELPIAEFQPLFSLMGWRFGGDGRATFRLPALWLGPVISTSRLSYGIAATGWYPMRDEAMPDLGTVGEIRFFAGLRAPASWLPCDGRALPIEAPYLELYDVIGTRWGGDVATFVLPNLWDAPEDEGPGSVGRLSYIVAQKNTPPQLSV